jgi:hypothetical protein
VSWSPRLIVVASIVGLVAVASFAACKGDPSPIATLIQTSTGTEKQAGEEGAWAAGAVGATFFKGDAIRTADGIALLKLNQSASLRVQPRSLIRFGERNGKSSIDVVLGEATLEGSGGKYQLGAEGLALDGQSSIRIVAGEEGTSYTLVLGKATLDQNGLLTTMLQGKTYEGVKLGDVEMIRPDAAPAPDAALPDAAPADAAPPPPAPETVALVITGKKATYLPDGEKTWMPVAAGPSELPAGTTLKLGARTSAKATRPGVTLDLPTGSRLGIGGEPFMAVTTGKVTATGVADTEGRFGLPGGHVVLKQGGNPAGATIDVRGRETKIVVTRGELELVGKGDKVELQHGETAILSAGGSIEIVDKIPSYFDLRVTAGESFTIHDPRPGTAVRFAFECGDKGGSVELVKDGAKRVTTGSDGANAMLGSGEWSYRQRCDGSGKVVKKGSIRVRRDDAHRELPRGQPSLNRVKADGVDYTIVYQNLVPSVEFKWPGASGSGITLHLSRSKKKTYPADGGVVVLSGKELSEGSSTFYFTNSDNKKSETSKLDVQFDNATPSVYIESPEAVAAFASQIDVKGSTLSGWSVSIDGGAIDVDRHGRFSTQVGAPSANALAIRLSHPKQGVHYYLRRQR